MCRRRQRVLPDQILFRHFRPEITGLRPHVAMDQLEPGAGECIGEGLGIVQKALGDLAELGVETQGQVGGEHGRLVELARDMRIRNDLRRILGHPLLGARRRLGQLPLVVEQVLEEVVAPQRRGLAPGDFDAAGDSVLAVTAAEVADPAQALRLDRRSLGLRPLVRLRRGAVGLAEGMTAGDQGNRLLIVHGHATEGAADVLGRFHIVATGVRALRVDIDQAHVGGAEWRAQFAVTGDALRIHAQPGNLRPPVHIHIRFPHVFTAGSKAEGAEAHGFERHVAGEDQQIGPGNLLPVLLLDRPEQAP